MTSCIFPFSRIYSVIHLPFFHFIYIPCFPLWSHYTRLSRYRPPTQTRNPRRPNVAIAWRRAATSSVLVTATEAKSGSIERVWTRIARPRNSNSSFASFVTLNTNMRARSLSSSRLFSKPESGARFSPFLPSPPLNGWCF